MVQLCVHTLSFLFLKQSISYGPYKVTERVGIADSEFVTDVIKPHWRVDLETYDLDIFG